MTTPAPELSVLIAAFHCERTIRPAVESVLASARAEVIVAPDDGKDVYLHLADEFGERVTVLTPSYRTGPGPARNRAFAVARGTFITMLDSDDALAPHALDEGLDLALASDNKIAFLRTRYIHEGTGELCRELPAAPLLTLRDFVDFHGSIHALYHRRWWQPYADHFLSQDVLHDGRLLVANGGPAPLTLAPYLLTLQPRSVTANALQEEFNAEYAAIVEAESDPAIRYLYSEKLRIGQLYAALLRSGAPKSFHEFIRDQLHRSEMLGT